MARSEVFLVDTSVWLERLLGQDRAVEVGQFLARVPSGHLSITDFAFHSICILLCAIGRRDALAVFIREGFAGAGLQVIRLEPSETELVLATMARFNLDFDDAYQYAAAEKFGLILVSLDSDFDRTERGRKTPAELLS